MKQEGEEGLLNLPESSLSFNLIVETTASYKEWSWHAETLWEKGHKSCPAMGREASAVFV